MCKKIQALKGKVLSTSVILFNMFFVSSIRAAQTVGDIAKNISDTFSNIALLITGGAYIGGMGFAIAAIMKFKQHKDNPTQIPIGTPIALLFVAAALIFLPTVFGVAGETIFGTTKAGGVAGTTDIM